MQFDYATWQERTFGILLLRTGGIGDVVMTLPTVVALRQAFPKAVIHYLTDSPSASLLRSLPIIDKVVVVNRKRPLAMLWQTRQGGYTLVLDFFQGPRTALLALASGAKWRVSFDFGRRKGFYNVRTPYHRTKFLTQQCLDMLRYLGIPTPTVPVFPGVGTEADRSAAHAFYAEQLNTPALALLPGASWGSKRCDASKLAEFTLALHQQHGYKPVLLGSPSDEPALEALETALLQLGLPAVRAPYLPLEELASWCAAAALVLCNDSGPGYLAAAAGARMLMLYGPTTPQLPEFGLVSAKALQRDELDCIRCHTDPCPRHHECFLGLEASRVLAAVESLGQQKVDL